MSVYLSRMQIWQKLVAFKVFLPDANRDKRNINMHFNIEKHLLMKFINNMVNKYLKISGGGF